MKKVLVCVKDNVAEIFHDIRCEINVASAIRAFSQSVQDSPHKDDYSLYLVGEMDTTNGTIYPGSKDSHNDPVRIYSGHDVKTNNVTPIEEVK
jgi:hypothetical protein